MSRKTRKRKPAVDTPAISPLRLMLLDKLVLGPLAALVLLVAGAIITVAADRYRSGDSLRQVVATTQLQKISEIWQRLDQYEAAVVAASAEGRQVATEPRWLTRGLPIAVRSNELKGVKDRLITSSGAGRRFWDTDHTNRLYLDDRMTARIQDRIRYIRFVELTEESDLREAEMRLADERRFHLVIEPGKDFSTPAIEEANKYLAATRATVYDIQNEVTNSRD